MSSEANVTGTERQPRIATADAAEAIRPFGIDMKVLIGGEHTGGTFSAITAEIRPGEGPPPHLHRDRDEYFYVLEGTYQLTVGDSVANVGPGAMVFVPRGTVHAFTNTASSTGKLLEWTIPGSNGDYFRAVHEMEAGGGFDPEKFAEINKRFVTEFAG